MYKNNFFNKIKDIIKKIEIFFYCTIHLFFGYSIEKHVCCSNRSHRCHYGAQ